MMPEPSPEDSEECFFLRLSDELITTVLRHLDTANLISCAQVSRNLNLLAVQAVLDEQELWHPESVCRIVISAWTPYPPDLLSALLISIHIKKLAYASFDLTTIQCYTALETPLDRLSRLIDRLESVDDVDIQFTPSPAISGTPSERKLKRLCQSFGHLFDILIRKGCTALRFSNLFTSDLGNYYRFKRPRYFKGYQLKPKDQKSRQPKTLEDIYYVRTALWTPRLIHIPPAPTPTLDQSKLGRFDATSVNMFRPPFSAWAFSMLESSRITTFGIGLEDLPPEREERDYILGRLAAVLSEVTYFILWPSVPKDRAHEVLSWMNSFEEMDTVSLPLNFPTDFDHSDIVQLSLPKLTRLECAPAFVDFLLEEQGRFDAPLLKLVSITEFGLNLSFLAESIPRTTNALSCRWPEAEFYIAMRFTAMELHNSVTPALRNGVRPVNLPNGFDGVAHLEVSVPATLEEILHGIWDNEIMGLLTLFPNIVSLLLCSTQAHLRRPSTDLQDEQMIKFKTRCAQLNGLVAF